MKKFLLTFLISLATLGGGAYTAYAQTVSSDLTITPLVIDEKAQQRDIIKESITLKNNTAHVLELYPSVNDISDTAGKESFTEADSAAALSDSLANWIEITRGTIQLSPGQEEAVPFVIDVNESAVANTYHAQISFTEGVTRAEADAGPALGTVLVNVEIQADVKELLQLNTFNTGNIFLSGDDVLFNYNLQNIGNQQLQPTGEISIYNRRGVEVATVPVNKDSKTISPNQIAQLGSVWSAANAFGRYKALLTVDYGSSGAATVQDTVFFWIVPWKQMLAMFIASLITIIVLSLYFHNWLERRHLYKFADAGLLNDDTLKKINGSEVPRPMAAASAISIPMPAVVAQPRRIVREETVTAPVVKEKSKRRFGIFKRKQPKVVASINETNEENNSHKSLREVLHKEERPHTHGHAIDLKQLRMHTQSAHAHAHHAPAAHSPHKAEVNGHVISLKKFQ